MKKILNKILLKFTIYCEDQLLLQLLKIKIISQDIICLLCNKIIWNKQKLKAI